MTDETNQAPAQQKATDSILRIYLKDVSLEAPNSPKVFIQKFNPEVNLQMDTTTEMIDEGIYEVVLNMTVTAKQGEKTGFLVEIQQAGLFAIKCDDEAQKDRILGVRCPNTLFPYAREAISDLVTKSGFPPLLLAPFSFGATYDEKAAEKTKDAVSQDT